MLGSAVLDVAIGIIFIYLFLSLICYEPDDAHLKMARSATVERRRPGSLAWSGTISLARLACDGFCRLARRAILV